jgi:hypothetical protein
VAHKLLFPSFRVPPQLQSLKPRTKAKRQKLSSFFRNFPSNNCLEKFLSRFNKSRVFLLFIARKVPFNPRACMGILCVFLFAPLSLSLAPSYYTPSRKLYGKLRYLRKNFSFLQFIRKAKKSLWKDMKSFFSLRYMRKSTHRGLREGMSGVCEESLTGKLLKNYELSSVCSLHIQFV